MDEQLRQIALRVNWSESPEELIRDKDRFLVYFMQYGLDTDVPTMRRRFSDQEFRQALHKRPPGILDERSATYWNLILSD
jgi:hypothetical protein